MTESCVDAKPKTVLNKTLGVMVVGAGGISGSYLDYFTRAEHTKLIAIADPSPQVRGCMAQKYKTVLIVSDYKEVLNRKDINMVVVCTPHNLHCPIVMDALRAGKDVICEKPIAISVSQADEMIDMAQSCGKRLFVALNMRFEKTSRKIKDILSNQLLGRVFMTHSAFLGYELKRMADPTNWKANLIEAGGGVLLDGGYHVVDLMNYWIGRAKYVQSMGGRLVVDLPQKGEDNVNLLVEYDNGVIANIEASFTVCNKGCNREPTVILEHKFYGTAGSLYN